MRRPHAQNPQSMVSTELEAQAASLKLALGAEPDAHDLVPFVKASDGDIAQAAARWKESQAARKEYRQLTVKDVAEFYRAPAGGGAFPCGCMFPLEDMKGGVHRDNLGRPIVVSLGMQHGSAVEMQRQYGYVSELLEAHKRPNGPHGACIVIEIRPRDPGTPPSFRFPDRDVRTLFDLGRDVYPESLYTTTHFCGLPRAVTWAFKLVRPFMRREAYAAMVLKPSFAHLAAVMPRGSMLQGWGGELAFDLDEWLEWRAKEEGVPTAELCPRNQGRAFDPAARAAASGEAMADSLHAGSIGARALLSGEVGTSGAPPRLHGAVEKRGSGRGMFGNVRWKPKLLAVCEVRVRVRLGLGLSLTLTLTLTLTLALTLTLSLSLTRLASSTLTALTSRTRTRRRASFRWASLARASHGGRASVRGLTSSRSCAPHASSCSRCHPKRRRPSG